MFHFLYFYRCRPFKVFAVFSLWTTPPRHSSHCVSRRSTNENTVRSGRHAPQTVYKYRNYLNAIQHHVSFYAHKVFPLSPSDFGHACCVFGLNFLAILHLDRDGTTLFLVPLLSSHSRAMLPINPLIFSFAVCLLVSSSTLPISVRLHLYALLSFVVAVFFVL